MARIGSTYAVTEEATEQQDRVSPPLPKGVYELEITGTDVKESENPRKLSINAVMEVRLPEEYAGRKLFTNYNLENPSADAQRIGQEHFQRLCRSLGMAETPEESDDLHLIPFIASVGMGKPSKETVPAQGDDGNPIYDQRGNVLMVPKYPARPEIKRYWYPDQNDAPEPHVEAANDNEPQQRQTARQPAPSTKPAAQAPAARQAGGGRPWPQRRAA